MKHIDLLGIINYNVFIRKESSMFIQYSFTEIVNKFLEDKECLQNFIETLEIPSLKQSEVLSANFISESDLTKSISKVDSENIDGFVISCKDYDIIFVSPSFSYLRFWGFRNFFGFRCGQKHKSLNDNKTRYFVNIMPHESMETYNLFKNFYLYNIENPSKEFYNWLEVLYKQ
jgi:hypothetical protein